MSEFEAEIRNSLRALTSQVTALSAGLEKTKSAGKKMGDEVQAAFKRSTTAISEAKAKQDAFNKSINETGSALKRIGGPLGALVSQISGSAGIASGMGRLATGASLLAIGWKAFSSVIDANIKRTQAMIDAQKELRTVSEGAAKSLKSQALGAVSSQGKGLRTLAFRSGDGAIDAANKISEAGITTPEDAIAGVSAAFKINYANEPLKTKNMRALAVRAASQVAQSGEGTLEESVNNIARDPLLLSRLSRDGGEADVAQRLIVRNRGQLETAGNLSAAKEDLKLRGTSRVANALTNVLGIQGQTATAEQAGITNGKAESAAREQLAETKDPQSAAMVELFRRQQQGDADMQRLIKEQGIIMAGVKDALMLLGGEGSFRNQDYNNRVGRAQATFSKD